MATLFEFANQVAKHVEYEEAVEVEKANGVKKVGVRVRFPEDDVAPTVYVKDFYDDGLSVQQTAAIVMRLAEENRVPEGTHDYKCFMDYEGYVKQHLKARLYYNQTQAEVKRDASYLGFEDLIIVPYVEMQVNGGGGAVKVMKEHLKVWDVKADEVIDTALKNSEKDVLIKDLFGMVEDMDTFFKAPDMPEMERPIYVTNDSTMFGASAILGLIPMMKERFKNGFFVLPSSVHEVLIMPANGEMNKADFDRMVDDVSTNVVSPEEVLGYQAYAFGV